MTTFKYVGDVLLIEEFGEKEGETMSMKIGGEGSEQRREVLKELQDILSKIRIDLRSNMDIQEIEEVLKGELIHRFNRRKRYEKEKKDIMDRIQKRKEKIEKSDKQPDESVVERSAFEEAEQEMEG